MKKLSKLSTSCCLNHVRRLRGERLGREEPPATKRGQENKKEDKAGKERSDRSKQHTRTTLHRAIALVREARAKYFSGRRENASLVCQNLTESNHQKAKQDQVSFVQYLSNFPTALCSS